MEISMSLEVLKRAQAAEPAAAHPELFSADADGNDGPAASGIL